MIFTLKPLIVLAVIFAAILLVSVLIIKVTSVIFNMKVNRKFKEMRKVAPESVDDIKSIMEKLNSIKDESIQAKKTINNKLTIVRWSSTISLVLLALQLLEIVTLYVISII